MSSFFGWEIVGNFISRYIIKIVSEYLKNISSGVSYTKIYFYKYTPQITYNTLLQGLLLAIYTNARDKA